MKILNLLEAPYQTTFVDRDEPDEHPEDAERLGGGRTADVYANKNDPHTVNRRSKIRNKEGNDVDYDVFADWLINSPEVRDNPHFPRIYKAEKNISNSKYYHQPHHAKDYEVERLSPLDKLDSTALRAVLRTHFRVNSITEEEFEQMDVFPDMVGIFAEEFVSNPGYDDVEMVPVGKFKAALLLIKEFLNETGLGFDAYYENIMVRRGPMGMQLVLTDPVID